MSHAALFPTITGAHWRAMFRRERGAGNAVRAQILSRVGRAGELEPMGLAPHRDRPAREPLAVAKGGRSITDTNPVGNQTADNRPSRTVHPKQ